eukprot:3334860-Rhodomonas_salina.1
MEREEERQRNYYQPVRAEIQGLGNIQHKLSTWSGQKPFETPVLIYPKNQWRHRYADVLQADSWNALDLERKRGRKEERSSSREGMAKGDTTTSNLKATSSALAQGPGERQGTGISLFQVHAPAKPLCAVWSVPAQYEALAAPGAKSNANRCIPGITCTAIAANCI